MGLGELSDPRLQQCTESKGVNGNGWGETKKIRKRTASMGLKAKSQGPYVRASETRTCAGKSHTVLAKNGYDMLVDR